MPALDPNLLNSDSNSNVYNQPLTLPVEFQQQMDEVNHFITSQNEKLRILVQEQRRQQMGTFLKKAESDMFHILRQKDEEIAQATKKRLELEQFLTRLDIENQMWRRAAWESEAMVLSVNNTLEQIKERALAVEEEEVGSCCDMKNHEEEKWENRVCCDQEITSLKTICKCCHSRESSCMFLPCRHLCSCKECEPSLQTCPVCLMPKRSIIENIIF